MSDLLDQQQGGLIASCQPVDEGPAERPEIVNGHDGRNR